MEKNESQELDDIINDIGIVEEPYIRYPKIKIGNIAQIKGGKRLPKGECLVNAKTDHPYIRAQDIRDGLISFNDPVYVTNPIFEKIKHYTVKENDVCITIVGANVGDVGIVPKFLNGANLTENAVKLTDLRNDCNSYFLKYILLSNGVQKHMKLFAGGAAQPKLGLYKINEVEIPFPPLPTQRKIAAILSTYDDLIENNTRRIKILEEMAQALYREWFVKFQFPEHEKLKMVESNMGMVPEGWEVVTIRDVSNYINRGVSPKYDDHSSQIVINQKCIRDGKFNQDLVRRHASKIPVEKSIKFGDVLINSTGIGTLGRIAQIYKEIPDCTVDSHVTIVRPNDKVIIDYFGSYLLTLESHFDSQGIGSTGQTELGRETIAKTSFLLPLRSIQDRFSEIISPMNKSIVKMFAKNANLRRTRDLLLPKLISGEVDVEKIDVLMLENGGA